MNNVSAYGIQNAQSGFSKSNKSSASGIQFAGANGDSFETAQSAKKSNFLFGGLEFLALGALAGVGLYFFRNAGAAKAVAQAGSKIAGKGGAKVLPQAAQEAGFLSKYLWNPIMDVARFVKKYTWDAVMGLFKNGEAVQQVTQNVGKAVAAGQKGGARVTGKARKMFDSILSMLENGAQPKEIAKLSRKFKKASGMSFDKAKQVLGIA
jgi:hypothetical protein